MFPRRSRERYLYFYFQEYIMTTKHETSNKTHIRNMVYSAMFLAITLLLPFLTGQVPQIGGMLCPMHLPVLLAGFVCGPIWGGAVGLVAPILRHMLFSMPPLMTAIAMTAELCAYGLLAGIFHRITRKLLPGKSLLAVYVSLVLAMLGGRIVWGLASAALMLAGQTEFSLQAFWASGFVSAWPGMVLQIVLIPPLWKALCKMRNE